MRESEESEAVFVLTIDNVFQLPGRGTVVLGIVQAGTVSVGDYLVLSSDESTFVCSGIELVQKRPKVEGFLALRLVDLAGNPADPDLLSIGAALRGRPSLDR
jgi:GTPase